MRELGKQSLASALKMALEVARILFWVAIIAISAFGLIVLALLASGGAWKVSSQFQADLSDPFGVLRGVAFGLIASGIGLYVIGRLRAIFATLVAGDPFVPENATHLRLIAFALMALEVAQWLVAALAMLSPSEGAAALSIKVNLSNWAAIAVLFVLSGIFREGARLRKEQQLTI